MAQQAAIKLGKNPDKCTTCGGNVAANQPVVPLVRWMGIRWIGRPKPLRLVDKIVRREVSGDMHAGCGCIFKLKLAWILFKKWAKA